jgi:hypothetical protein
MFRRQQASQLLRDYMKLQPGVQPSSYLPRSETQIAQRNTSMLYHWPDKSHAICNVKSKELVLDALQANNRNATLWTHFRCYSVYWGQKFGIRVSENSSRRLLAWLILDSLRIRVSYICHRIRYHSSKFDLRFSRRWVRRWLFSGL